MENLCSYIGFPNSRVEWREDKEVWDGFAPKSARIQLRASTLIVVSISAGD